MPCMCGDTRCHSCGPAQGNNYCYICGKFDDEGGCQTPEKCQKELDMLDAERQRDDLIAEIIENHGGYEETTREFRISLDEKTMEELKKMVPDSK